MEAKGVALSQRVTGDGALKEAAPLQIGFHVIELLKDKNMKQREISTLLEIKQAEVSHLLNGHFSRFSVEKLMDFLMRLNQKITIQISPHKEGESYQNIAFGV